MEEPPSRGNVLFGVSGSVAAIKAEAIVDALHKIGFKVRMIATQSSLHFLNLETLKTKLGESVLVDKDEWEAWGKRGDPVLHIQLRKWADLFVVAPLSANTLAKFSNGLADNLLTCVARAWDFSRPFLVCPAMNSMMLHHPVTAPQLNTLRGFGITVVPTVSKKLMCGDTGDGAMADVATIVSFVSETKLNVT